MRRRSSLRFRGFEGVFGLWGEGEGFEYWAGLGSNASLRCGGSSAFLSDIEGFPHLM
jgi:hypothetical protein